MFVAVIHNDQYTKERICFNSNSSETDLTKLTLRIRYEHSGHGVFCTDTLFNSSSACVADVDDPQGTETTSWMFFNVSNHIGDEGDFSVNFTINEELRASVSLYYGEFVSEVHAPFRVPSFLF